MGDGSGRAPDPWRTGAEQQPTTPNSKMLQLDLSSAELQSLDSYDLTRYASVTAVDLSHNALSSLTELAFLSHLTQLDVSHNRLRRLAGVPSLTSLTSLDISYNSVSSLSEVSKLVNLKTLTASCNMISTLAPLAAAAATGEEGGLGALPPNRLTALQNLDLRANKISQIDAVEGALECLYPLGLVNLDLRGNMIAVSW